MSQVRAARRARRPSLAALALVFGLGCRSDPPTSIDFTAIDRSVNPCEDFYQYACGNWLVTHPISSAGSTRRRFDDAFYTMVPQLRAIIENDAAGRRGADDPQAELIGDYYQSCMAAPDQTAGRTTVVNQARLIAAAATLDQLASLLAMERQSGSGALFTTAVAIDPGVPTQRIVLLDSGGLELSDRADYLDPLRTDLRAAYRQHILDLSRAYGQVQIDPDAVIAVETALAAAARDPSEDRDPRAAYNPMTLDALKAMSPTFPWDRYFGALGFTGVTRVDVTDPAYFTALDTLLTSTPIEGLAAYAAWQLLQDSASYVDQEILDTDFPFWSRWYTGEPAPPPRDWTCMNATLSALGMAVSQPYVKRYVSPDVRTEARALVNEIQASMRQHLAAASWLDDQTRAEAEAKLDVVTNLVGYPDEWPTYEGLTLDSGSYIGNHLALTQFGLSSSIQALSLPVDRAVWTMAPITVNASYMLTNVIQMPAGILQLPFFAAGDSPAANYGAIGSVIAHETTHGFDDDGRQYDGSGVLRDWWTPSVEAAFRARAQCLVDQFSGYSIDSDVPLDGALELGENTADLGGVRVSFDAFTAAHPGEPSRGGYSGAQQFFLSFAQLYCSNTRPELLSEQVMTDPHAPAPWRVNGTLVNVPEFADAFQCHGPAPFVAVPTGRSDICEIW